MRLATQCGAALDVVNVFDYMPPVGEEQYAGLDTGSHPVR